MVIRLLRRLKTIWRYPGRYSHLTHIFLHMHKHAQIRTYK